MVNYISVPIDGKEKCKAFIFIIPHDLIEEPSLNHHISNRELYNASLQVDVSHYDLFFTSDTT